MSRLCVSLMMGCMVGMLTVGASAQEAQQLSATQLRQQIQQLDQQLAAERAASEQLGATQKEELDSLRQKRSTLAEQVLDARAQLEQNRQQIDMLQSEIAPRRQAADQLEQDVQRVRSAAIDAAERTRIGLSEMPAADEAQQALKEAVTSLRESDTPTDAATLDALDTIAAQLDAAHQQSTHITTRIATIYTADGQQEKVTLLSVGAVRFAYVTDNGQRVGVALASPSNTSGYRWSEAIGAGAADRIRSAIDALEAGADVVTIPMDPTGRVQPETLAREQSLEDRARAGGPVMIPLAVVALLALLLIFERAFVLYGRNRYGNAVARKVVMACVAEQYDQARAICERSTGAVGRVLAACLARRPRGQRAMEDSIQEQLLQEMPRLNRFMGGIAILAAVAPLLGLLGTVTGIIQTFGVIRAFGNANPSLMAGGISEALITTAAGLTLAIPILIVHAVLRGRSDRIIADAERHAATLLTQLAHDHPEADAPRSPATNDSDQHAERRTPREASVE